MPKMGRASLEFSPVRVVVLMSPEMAAYLDKKAERGGMGNRSVLLRYVITQMMNDEGLPNA